MVKTIKEVSCIFLTSTMYLEVPGSSPALAAWFSFSINENLYEINIDLAWNWSSLQNYVLYKRKKVIENLPCQESYKLGFNKIGEILDYCETFNISTVSVYAFSIENFKRSEVICHVFHWIWCSKLVQGNT